MNVVFNNNVIEINDATIDEHKEINNLWVLVREDYTNLVSEIRLKKLGNRKTVAESFVWKGMSSWWLNSLVRKDIDVDNWWLHRLMVLYLCKKFLRIIDVVTDDKTLITSIKKNFPFIEVTINKVTNNTLKDKIKIYFPGLFKRLLLVRRSISEIEILLLLAGLRKKQKVRFSNSRISVLFRSNYPASWVTDKEVMMDRHLRYAPLLDEKHKQISCYLMYVTKSSKYKGIGFFRLWNDLRSIEYVAGREVYYPEAHLRVIDIVESYCSTFMERKKFLKWRKLRPFLDIFTMNDIDVSDILLEEWDNNYFSSLNYNKLHSLAAVRFLEDVKRPVTIVSYGEFFVQSRYAYFEAKRVNPNNKFVVIQHAMYGKNRMFSYFRNGEFNKESSGLNFSPIPDYYLAQGEQYKSILETFYSRERIHIIGCLKYDIYFEILKNYNSIKNKLIEAYDLGEKTVILLAPSTNDVTNIFSILSDMSNDENVKIVLSPHPFSELRIIKEIHKIKCPNLDIRYVTDVPTNYLLTVSSLVLCGYSTVAVEAAYFGVQSVRLNPLGEFPLFEKEKLIPSFYTPDQFSKWFNEQILDKKISKAHRKNLRELGEKYFYKIDGKTADRLWEFLDKVKHLPHHSNQIGI